MGMGTYPPILSVYFQPVAILVLKFEGKLDLTSFPIMAGNVCYICMLHCYILHVCQIMRMASSFSLLLVGETYCKHTGARVRNASDAAGGSVLGGGIAAAGHYRRRARRVARDVGPQLRRRR